MSLTSLQSLGISHVIAPPNNCRSENMVRKQDSVSSRNRVHFYYDYFVYGRTEATTSLAFYSIGHVSRPKRGVEKKSSKVNISSVFFVKCGNVVHSYYHQSIQVFFQCTRHTTYAFVYVCFFQAGANTLFRV